MDQAVVGYVPVNQQLTSVTRLALEQSRHYGDFVNFVAAVPSMAPFYCLVPWQHSAPAHICEGGGSVPHMLASTLHVPSFGDLACLHFFCVLLSFPRLPLRHVQAHTWLHDLSLHTHISLFSA